MHPNINPANAVTASRFFTLPPFAYFVEGGHYQAALFTVLVCGLLDKFDGLVAKIFDCRTAFGSIFDAITDAICYGFCLAVLAYYGWVPRLAVVLLLGLGALNTVLRGLYSRRAGRTVNYTSYAMERIVGFYAFLIGFGCAQYEVEYFYWGCVAFTAVVVLHDSKRMLVDPVPA